MQFGGIVDSPYAIVTERCFYPVAEMKKTVPDILELYIVILQFTLLY